MIGIFAGIAEVAGTVVLPFVSEQLQYIFIWYVMIFPVFLVGLFFYTLIRHNKKLYAPSDFANEENFIKLANEMNNIETIAATVKSNDENSVKELETSVDRAKAYLDSIMHEKLDNISDTAVLPLKLVKVLSDNPDGLTQREIAEKLGMSLAGARRMIQNMKMNGLVYETIITDTTNGISRKTIKYSMDDKGGHPHG